MQEKVHKPVAISDGPYMSVAEVCEACSNFETGNLVPTAFCDELVKSGLLSELEWYEVHKED